MDIVVGKLFDGPCTFFPPWYPLFFYGLWNVNCWLGSVQFCWFSVGRRGCYHDRAEGRKLEFCAWGLSLFMAEFVLHSLSPAALISWFSNWQGQIVEDASCSDWQGTHRVRKNGILLVTWFRQMRPSSPFVCLFRLDSTLCLLHPTPLSFTPNPRLNHHIPHKHLSSLEGPPSHVSCSRA